jgi:ATP-dependent helicase/DNAse subunit B
LAELSVTKFRDYIACPYRFYLGHVLKLQTISDEAAELDGGAFGDLVHFVLEQFGRDDQAADARVSADPSRIVEYLDYQLGRITAARYGNQVRPAVRVQVEQVRLRLKAFAEWQAARARDGWRIVFSEDSEERRTLTAPFAVDGQPFTLRGRIDRIDYHESLARQAVLDYKTADGGLGPERTHRKADAWVDLQLPLYRHLLRAANLAANVPADAQVEMGYVLLPRDLSATGLALAEWDGPMLAGADERARQIIRAIRAQEFWPPTSPPPEFADDVAVLCHDHRLGSFRSGEGDAA